MDFGDDLGDLGDLDDFDLGEEEEPVKAVPEEKPAESAADEGAAGAAAGGGAAAEPEKIKSVANKTAETNTFKPDYLIKYLQSRRSDVFGTGYARSCPAAVGRQPLYLTRNQLLRVLRADPTVVGYSKTVPG